MINKTFGEFIAQAILDSFLSSGLNVPLGMALFSDLEGKTIIITKPISTAGAVVDKLLSENSNKDKTK
jgi:hypothetical protein